MRRTAIPFHHVALLLAFGAFVTVGAGCRKETLDTKQGELVVASTDDSGREVLSRDATIGFGATFVGKVETRTVVVKNLGSGPLTLSDLSVQDGADARVVSAATEAAGFEIVFSPGQTIGPAEQVALTATYRPKDGAGDETAVLTLHATNTVDGADSAKITFTGRAVSGQCELPEQLDFGTIETGAFEERSIQLHNPTELAVNAYASAATGFDAAAFPFAEGSDQGDLLIPAGDSKTVTFRFSPTEARNYLATARARMSAECPERVVKLVGTAVDQVLSWAPAKLDFGYVPTGATDTRTLTFTNVGNADVEISAVKAGSATEFEVSEAAFTVPGHGGTHDLTLTFHSSVIGPRTSSLTFSTSLMRQPKGTVALTAFGGGPRIQVKPTTLSFGKVAYFASAPNLFQTRHLDILNIGTSKPGDAAGNLKLGQPQPDGSRAMPYAVVTPANADTAADEFEVSLLPTPAYDPNVGLAPIAGKNAVALEVKLTPKSIAKKQAVVTIYSNDLLKPEVTIDVTADAVALPPCQYQVSPTSLNFGVVAPTEHKELGFGITNVGKNAGDVCLISALDVQPGSDAAFSVGSGAVAEKELAPGETMVVQARVWPQTQPAGGATAITGTIGFFVSSDLKPSATVALNATVTSSCLLLSPDSIDFGTVKKGCNSATRSVSIYNACPAAVTLSGIDLIAAAGQPAGGPDCPGTSPCPEFAITSSPAIPMSGLVLPPGGSPVAFSLRYTPIDYGADPGVIGVRTVENGLNALHTLSLKGAGDALGLQTDVFTQTSTPQSDILLVIDGSCSMGSKQQSLANNMASFFTYANSGGVDYHIAVIDGQGKPSNPLAVGTFTHGGMDPDAVLTPTSSQVESQFQAKVTAIGANGADEQCFEPAMNALTAPLSLSTNAGFLRPDASLSIICVTDDRDYSPSSATYYLAALQNIKGAAFKSLFSLSAIAVFQQSCGIADDGRYANMVQWTGGVKEEICTTDWAKSLKNISQVAFGARGTFYLTAPVDQTAGAIGVKIDGQAVPATINGKTVWTYDAITNSVTFDPLYRPQPGETLEITYYVNCY